MQFPNPILLRKYKIDQKESFKSEVKDDIKLDYVCPDDQRLSRLKFAVTFSIL